MKKITVLAVLAYSFVGFAQSPCIDIKNFDKSVKPGDNFFLYVNGSWMKKNPIPASEARWGSFNIIGQENDKALLTILKELANTNAEPGSAKQKAGDFYFTAMDTAAIERSGITSLTEEFSKIDQISNPNQLMNVVAHLHMIGIRPLFSFSVEPDPKSSSENILILNQAGLSLPDMDYYANPDTSINNIRLKYKTHIANMFSLMGEKPETAYQNAELIFEMESELASVSMTRVQLRDIQAQYNKMQSPELTIMVPEINWVVYFSELGIYGKVRNVIVSQPKFFARVNAMIADHSLNEWKIYLRWHLLNSTADLLSSIFSREHFNFYEKPLSGAKQQKPRWKKVVRQADDVLGELLGQLYIEKNFSAESKKKVNEMVDNLFEAYKEHINSRTWMSEATKQQAQRKLSTIMRKLAYPDKWRDYSTLEIKRDAYVLNCLRGNEFQMKFMFNKLGKPIDKTEWGMTPSTVNAYYNPSYNEIVFPAGIMHSPFFDPNADDAVNYGAMGSVIGHELTHGFDDQGSQYDWEGNLKNWWTKDDSTQFRDRTKMVVKQYNNFVTRDTLKVNGELTQGENIADLGGLTLAYAAYQISLKGKPAPLPIDGLTSDQRFFISWAQVWRGDMRTEALKNLLKTNPHSPYNARVNVPLSNLDAFYRAFNIKPGDKLYRRENDRVEIW